MDIKMIAIIGLSLAAVWGFVSALINAAANTQLTHDIEELSSENNNLSHIISRREKAVAKQLDQITHLESKLSTANLLLHNKDVEIAELEGKLKVTSRTNTKLLKEVADDITVNVKAGDDANLKVQKPKRRKPYKKKKPNGGSATNNNKAGEKK
jgi:hypothetical protein